MTDCPACSVERDMVSHSAIQAGYCVICGGLVKAYTLIRGMPVTEDVAACYRLGGIEAVYVLAMNNHQEHSALLERSMRWLARYNSMGR